MGLRSVAVRQGCGQCRYVVKGDLGIPLYAVGRVGHDNLRRGEAGTVAAGDDQFDAGISRQLGLQCFRYLSGADGLTAMADLDNHPSRRGQGCLSSFM